MLPCLSISNSNKVNLSIFNKTIDLYTLDEQTGSTKHVQPNWSLSRRKLSFMESTSANNWVNSISEEQRGDVWDGPERGKWKQTCSNRASHGDRMPHAPVWHSDIGLAWAWWMYKLKVRPTPASPDSGSGQCLHPGSEMHMITQMSSVENSFIKASV